MSKARRNALLAGAGVVAAEWPIYIQYDVPTFSLQDAADSILALDRFVNRLPNILDALSPGLRRAYAIPLLDEITHQSPFTEKICVKLFFGSERGMNKNLAEIRKKYNVKSLSDIHPLVPWIVIGGIIVGAGYFGGAMHDKFWSNPGTPESLGFSHNTIINIGDTSTIKAGDLVKIIEAAQPNVRRLAEDTVHILKPTQGTPGASLQVGMTSLPQPTTIPKSALADVPVIMPPLDKQETVTNFSNQIMEVRAADYDSSVKGWGVIIPYLITSRLPFRLDPSIDPAKLAGKTKLIGDVDVTYSYDEFDRKKKPSLITLRVLKSAE